MVKGAARAAQLRRRLGARIRALRGDRKLTQEAVAGRLGVSPKYVSQLECGQRSPSWKTLVAIAHYGLETNVAALMFGIDEDVEVDLQELSEVLAGWPKEARRDFLQAVRLLLRGRRIEVAGPAPMPTPRPPGAEPTGAAST